MCKIKKIYILLLLLILSCNSKESKNNDEKNSVLKSENIQKDESQTLPNNQEELDSVILSFEGKGSDDCQMIHFNAGYFTMGADDRNENEKPKHKVKVNSFYLDKHPVTVAQFRKFVEATNYKTDAEKFGDAGIYNYKLNQWELIKNSTWEKPFVTKKAEDNHPVTQVSWRDALAYAKWIGKRLPTEEEWEYAAKNGNNNGTKYPWGNEAFPQGKYMANIWTDKNFNVKGNDGYEYTSPVGAFGEHPSGLTDMSGNVHEWTSSVYEPYSGSKQYHRFDKTIKVIRGGAFTADESGLNGFTTTFRGQNTWETSLFNTGFRCAKD